MTGPFPSLLGSIGVETTTWDPTGNAANVALSNGNLTFTTSSAGSKKVRCITGRTTGKYYFEAQIATIGTSTWIGLANSSATNTASQTDANVASLQATVGGGANAYIAGVNQTPSFPAMAANDIIRCAVDLGAKKIWWAVNGGQWNASGTADPATGVGGLDLTPMFSGTLLFAGGGISGGVVNANFGGSAYTYGRPTGYSDWRKT